ncbi:MAG: GlsB/YeaQ/YmgE family stress response membrane protein [Verrucomicrobia bacterium]|nr:MAG: GlsB/YeaQ/YmgE family stress response membrane protein [Verrucomicrobiota bacterium]
MLHIIWSIIVGAIIGGIAEAVVPGRQHLGFWKAALLGIAGSIIGGLIGRLFSKPEPGAVFHPAGFLMSIICSVLLLVIWMKLIAPAG